MNYSGYHTHTTFSDGKNTMEEMVQAAIALGMPSIGFTDHSYSPYQKYCMKAEDYPAYFAEIDRLREKYGDKITIMKGLELDSHSDPSVVKELDYFLGSVHELVYGDRFYGIDHALDLQQECIDKELGGSKLAFAKAYYEELTDHILRTKPTIIGHFDVITKFSLLDEDDPAYQKIALEALDKAFETTRVMEINTGAISRNWRDVPYPAMFLLKRWKELGGEVILGADTHATNSIDCAFPLAIQRAKEAGFDRILTLWPDGFHEEEI